jgi:hypothetical protein
MSFTLGGCMRSIIRYLIVGASALIIFSALGLAQDFGAIAGVVKDSSGAALPGVMVEATSPALIEKSRTATSDDSGQFRVEQLRPGSYTVTFTLSGFSTVRREGIDISAGFTAPVNVSLRVGGVQETIEVQGEAPVVDVQNVAQQRTLVKDELDALPTARSFATLGTTIPSVSANQYDVGGTQGERGNVLSAHGSNGFDMTLQVDGIPISVMGAATPSGNAWSTFSLNDAAVQELSFETSAISAEASSGGVRVNVIPREGGNAFHGTIFGDYANRSMSMNNLTSTEKAQGLMVVPGFDLLYDETVGIGGPIKKDRLWFYYAQRYRSNDIADINTYYSINPLSTTYNPDLKRPAHSGGFDLDNQMRVTTQVTSRNKVSFFFDKVNKCNCPTILDVPVFTAESTSRLTYSPNGVWVGSISWLATISPKLVLDTAVSYNRQDDLFTPLAPTVTATGPISITSIDQTGVHILRAPTPGVFTGGEYQNQANLRSGLSYVTGRHSLKAGVDYHYGHRSNPTYETSSDVSYLVVFGRPLSATFYSAPYVQTQNIGADMGLYAQDKWTLRRLTINYGIRWDYFNSSIPAQSVPADIWLPARTFAAVPNVPNWKDIDPRVGVSYDVFGKGKTAIKASISRYVSSNIYSFANNINPISAGGGSTVTRAITNPNININLPPNGDPTNPNANGDLGPGPANFGQSFISTTYDPNLSKGWGKRPYNWEYSASVQQELVPRISLEAGYFRRKFYNQTVIDNLQTPPSDFDQFCITLPNAQGIGLPSVGAGSLNSLAGRQICGLADINPAYAALTTKQVVTFANHFPGDATSTYDGFDLNVNVHPSGKFFLLAGLSVGRTDSGTYAVPVQSGTAPTQSCAVLNNPMNQLNCQSNQPFQGQYRVSGGYTLPWKLQLSGVYQSIPPASFQPTLNVTATTQSTLGRPITEGSLANVPVVAPYKYFTDRVNQVDLRLTKAIPIREHVRLELMVDLYNALNASPVLTRNNAIGAGFYTPTSILQSGFVKLGGRFSF